MNNKLVVRINSFSYHISGIPEDFSGNNGGFVFDCRFLPNPGRDPQYATLTGKDEAVINYFESHKVVDDFLKFVFKIIKLAVTNYISRGFTDLMVSFGCTGGQHRSVYCADRLAEYLQTLNVSSQVRHIELEKLNRL